MRKKSSPLLQFEIKIIILIIKKLVKLNFGEVCKEGEYYKENCY